MNDTDSSVFAFGCYSADCCHDCDAESPELLEGDGRKEGRMVFVKLAGAGDTVGPAGASGLDD